MSPAACIGTMMREDDSPAASASPSRPLSHHPVLVAEAVALLAPKPAAVVVDCTVGLGGHSLSILPRLVPGGRLIAMDRDAQALTLARARLVEFASQIEYLHENFRHLPEVLQRLHLPHVDGLIADLGLSSLHVDSAERGFSFLQEGPLDMRMDPTQHQTAASLIRQLSERELADLLFAYGEERRSRRIAKCVVEARRRAPIQTTTHLADLIARAVPSRSRAARGPHPATRSFQALRIAVNDELGALKELLAALPTCLAPGGRAVIISFHSLEDRLVKHAIRDGVRAGRMRALTRKPVRPSEQEMAANPRSRSARLRAVERV